MTMGDGPIVLVVVVVHALPAHLSLSVCLSVGWWCINLQSGASPSTRLPTDAVACRISVLGLVFYSLVRPRPS